MIAVGVPVLAVSNVTGEGIESVQALLEPAKTFVLLGSSGTGKSTLVNRLAGRAVMETGGLRKGDGRGRHTTRHRQLLVMPGGAILIDTPACASCRSGRRHRQCLRRHRRLASQCRFKRLRALDGARLRRA